MKKLLLILLTLAMIFSLAACGGDEDKTTTGADDKTQSSNGQQEQTSKPAESQQSTASTPSEDGTLSGEEKEPLVKNVGDTVEHGSFEGLTLEWLTLAVDEENEKALLVTKDIIAHWVYDSAVMEDVTWETSDIREWLNGTFYNGAFSEEQKAYILESEIVNSANPVTGTESGADTVDRVFLLSYEEAQTYFPTDESRQACYNFSQEYMAYLAKMMADTPSLEKTEQEALDELDGYNDGTDWPDSWWLRTSGDGQQTAAGVGFDGIITEYQNQVWAAHGIRPAIWVDLSDEQAVPGADTQGGSTDNNQQTSSGADGFSIPTLNSYDTFPPADYWTALGLPADFTIEISEMEFSSKNSIYPLNAKDGNMFTCVVSDNIAAYTTLADSLWNAGIKGVSADGTSITEAADRGEVDDYDIDEHIYKAYWLNNGELMDIYIRTRDGSNKITITVRHAPED